MLAPRSGFARTVRRQSPLQRTGSALVAHLCLAPPFAAFAPDAVVLAQTVHFPRPWRISKPVLSNVPNPIWGVRTLRVETHEERHLCCLFGSGSARLGGSAYTFLNERRRRCDLQQDYCSSWLWPFPLDAPAARSPMPRRRRHPRSRPCCRRGQNGSSFQLPWSH
jgi:hypothetical protein